MSDETRSPYREDLYATYLVAFGDQTDAIIANGGNASIEAIMECRLHGIEAVAAQVLRDLRDGASHLPLDLDTVTIQEYVERFAAERGIDLEGDTDGRDH